MWVCLWGTTSILFPTRRHLGCILLDDVNLATAETLLALAPLMDGMFSNKRRSCFALIRTSVSFAAWTPQQMSGRRTFLKRWSTSSCSILTDETSRESYIKTYSHETRNWHFIPSYCILLLHECARYDEEQQLTDGTGRRIMVLASRNEFFISIWTS